MQVRHTELAVYVVDLLDSVVTVNLNPFGKCDKMEDQENRGRSRNQITVPKICGGGNVR